MKQLDSLGRTASIAGQTARLAVRTALALAVLFTLAPCTWAALTKVDIFPPTTASPPVAGTYVLGAGTTFTMTSDGTGFYPNMNLNPTWDGVSSWVQPDTNATGDVMTFAYESISGDFDRRIQVTGITNDLANTDAWTRGGIMVRTATNHFKTSFQVFASNPQGANVAVLAGRAIDGQNYTEWDRRLAGVTNALPNQWLRIRRVGDYFTAYVGTNGTTWTLIAQHYQVLPAALILGPYASSGTFGTIATVKFANYGATPLTDAIAPTLVSAGTLDKAIIGVRFSEPVTKATATVLANYSITQGVGAQAVTVTAAKLGIGADAVYLTVTGLTNDNFTVKVIGGVQDVAGNTIAANTSVAARALNWNHADIGYFSDTTARPKPGDDPYNAGQAVMVSSDENPEIEIIGGGSNAWNPGDFIHYIWRTQPLTGNFDVTVAVTRNDHCNVSGGGGTGGWANSGLMLRKAVYVPGDNPTATILTNYLATQAAMIANTTYEEADSPGRASIALWRYHDHEGYNNGGIIGWGSVIGGTKGYYSDLRAIDASGNVDPVSSAVSARYLRIKRVGTQYTMYVSFNRNDWALVDGPRDLPDLPDQLLLGFSTMNDSGSGNPPYGGYGGMGHQIDMTDPLNPANTGATNSLGTPVLGIVQNDSNYSVQRIKVFPNGVTDPLPTALTFIDIRPADESGTPPNALSGSWTSTGTLSFNMTGGGTGVFRNLAGPAFDGSSGGDELSFAWETVTGDFDKQVAITSLTNLVYNNDGSAFDYTNGTPVLDVWARAGLMVRSDPTNSYSQCLKLVVGNPAGANEVRVIGRGIDAAAYNTLSRSYSGVSNAIPNQYIRIKRVGNSFTFYVGTDGVVWAEICHAFKELPSTVFFGPYCAASLDPNNVGANPDGQLSRAFATFTAYKDVELGDVTGPVLISAGTIDKKTVGVKFNEQISSGSGTVLANYSLSQGTVTAAKIGQGGDSVYLTVSGLVTNTFTLSVTNVTDTKGNKISGNPSVIVNVSGWTATDIGYLQNPSPRTPTPGDDPYRIGQTVATSSEDSDTSELEVVGGGSNEWQGDYLHYVYKPTPLTGNFDIACKISRYDKSGTGGYDNSGIMMRESLYLSGQDYTVAGTKVKFMDVITYHEGGGGPIPVWRDTQGANAAGSGAQLGTGTVIAGRKGYFADHRAIDSSGHIDPQSSPFNAQWLRIKRTNGTNFAFYASWDGFNWNNFDNQTITFLQDSVLLGYMSCNDSGDADAPFSAYRPNGHTIDPLDPLGASNGHGYQNESNYTVTRVRIYKQASLIGAVKATSNGANVAITYSGTLVSSANLTGPWNVVPSQSSPYQVSPTAAKLFYRVIP